jgi:hypothetical protein
MVDFANCVTKTCPDYTYPPTTSGPDGGYLLGLKTMIHNFEELHAEIALPDLVDERGHVSISCLTLKQRATAEIGLF